MIRHSWALVVVMSLVVGCGSGGGGGGGDGGEATALAPLLKSVEVDVGYGTIGNLLVDGINLMGTTVQPDGQPYKGGAYLIGSCSSNDDENNVTSRTFGPFTPLHVGESAVWLGTMKTINGSRNCLGPDYTWILSRPTPTTLHSTIDIYNVRQALASLSVPADFVKQPSSRFVYSHPPMEVAARSCEIDVVDARAMSFLELPRVCDNGAGILAGFAIQRPPLDYAEWRNDDLRVGLRRQVLGGDYQYFIAFNVPGTDALQASWDHGPIPVGTTLHAEEEWELFSY